MSDWSASDLADIEAVMADRLEGFLAPGESVRVAGETTAEEVHAAFRLEGGRAGERVDLEARVDRLKTKLSEDAARDLALDAMDALLLDYLESERQLRFTGVFEERELRGKPVSVRAERTVPNLEAQADALLEGGGKGEDA